MLISTDVNAAQFRASGEPTRFYDDIGCLAADIGARANDAVRYVHMTSGSWSLAEAAWYARPPAAKTPMDYGVVAFPTEEAALAADREKRAQRWPDVVSLAESR